MKYYDVDGDGNITYDEFLKGLRDDLTERRKLMVEKAWTIMDKDKSGKITVSDIGKEKVKLSWDFQCFNEPGLLRRKENKERNPGRFP